MNLTQIFSFRAIVACDNHLCQIFVDFCFNKKICVRMTINLHESYTNLLMSSEPFVACDNHLCQIFGDFCFNKEYV